MSHDKKGPERVWVAHNALGEMWPESSPPDFSQQYGQFCEYTRSDLYDALKAKVMELDCRYCDDCTQLYPCDVCKLKAEIGK